MIPDPARPGEAARVLFVAVALSCVGPVAVPAVDRELLAQTGATAGAIVMEVTVAPVPVPVEGTPRLVYELAIESHASEPLVVESIDVVDAGPGAVIATLQGDALEHRLRVEGGPSAPGNVLAIAPGARGRVYLELSPGDAPLPRSLEHRLTYRVAGSRSTAPVTVRGAHVAVRDSQPVVLAPPVRGGPWVAVYDPAWERGHRRVVYTIDRLARIPGRFAIDWIRVDAEGRYARGDEDVVRNWYSYGAEVLAVADARVAAARDDVAESPTISGHPDHPLEDATGNYVALDLGDGRFAFYEHLAPGSIRVAVGDEVRRGEVIAAAGFTGHTTGPHLHFHVADAASPLGAEGVPFVFERFRLLGRYDDFGAFGRAPRTPIGERVESLRRRELPAPNAVIDFGDAGTSNTPANGRGIP